MRSPLSAPIALVLVLLALGAAWPFVVGGGLALAVLEMGGDRLQRRARTIRPSAVMAEHRLRAQSERIARESHRQAQRRDTGEVEPLGHARMW